MSDLTILLIIFAVAFTLVIIILALQHICEIRSELRKLKELKNEKS